MLLLCWPLLPRPLASLVGVCLTIHQLRRSRFKPSFEARGCHLQARAIMATASFEAWPWPLATTREFRRSRPDLKSSFELERSWRL
ncbi:hypothetical protein NL676_028656 [Syzygium grande]|nr:hypothetical protein NL676_028656 [Syzygium grande]